MYKGVTEVTVMQSQSQSGQGIVGWKQEKSWETDVVDMMLHASVHPHSSRQKLHSIWHFEMQPDKCFLVTLAHSKVNYSFTNPYTSVCVCVCVEADQLY